MILREQWLVEILVFGKIMDIRNEDTKKRGTVQLSCKSTIYGEASLADSFRINKSDLVKLKEFHHVLDTEDRYKKNQRIFIWELTNVVKYKTPIAIPKQPGPPTWRTIVPDDPGQIIPGKSQNPPPAGLEIKTLEELTELKSVKDYHNKYLITFKQFDDTYMASKRIHGYDDCECVEEGTSYHGANCPVIHRHLPLSQDQRWASQLMEVAIPRFDAFYTFIKRNPATSRLQYFRQKIKFFKEQVIDTIRTPDTMRTKVD